jgi:anaerobic selenocysteine-containing dehydrogenase
MLGYADSRRTHDAIKELDFVAVSDIFMTPTASLADVVLPAATHFEFDDIGHYGLGHGYILARPKVVDPPQQCWPDIRILNELGKLLTPAGDWFDDHRRFLDAMLKPCGLKFSEFAERSYLKGPDHFYKYRSSGFKTPTGKVELVLSMAEKLGFPGLPGFDAPPEIDDPEYPLVLTSSKNRYFLHSSYRWMEKLRNRCPEPLVDIHPDTAVKYRIADGDAVCIETRVGSITQYARLSDSILPGVVHAAYGWWFPEGKIETQYDWEISNYNILTSTRELGKAFGTPNLKGINCRIRRLSSGPEDGI